MVSTLRQAVLAIAVLTVLCGGWDELAGQSRPTGKPRLGYSDIVVANRPRSPDACWERANVVAEVMAIETGPAFERDPNTPARYKMPWTPTVVQVREVFKNSSGLTVEVGQTVRVLQAYGRVETRDYYVELDADRRDFERGQRSFVFLHCAENTDECETRGPVLRINGESLANDRATDDLRAHGTTGMRARLRALAGPGRHN